MSLASERFVERLLYLPCSHRASKFTLGSLGGIVRPLIAATIAAFVSACGSMPEGSPSQVAPRYTLTIALGGSGSGSVRSTDGAIDCPASQCTATTQAG